MVETSTFATALALASAIVIGIATETETGTAIEIVTAIEIETESAFVTGIVTTVVTTHTRVIGTTEIETVPRTGDVSLQPEEADEVSKTKSHNSKASLSNSCPATSQSRADVKRNQD